tara:strand:- start:103 stop:1212 length:1110 start_codon:yes stop_codon:yes gene_type:complete
MEKNQKKLIMFMPSIDGGGVEKNIFLITNYLTKHIKKVCLITFDKRFKNNFKKKVDFISFNFFSNLGINKYFKYFGCLLILTFVIIKNNRKVVVFSFQANIYSILICKLLNVKIITRSNSSPSGWSQNYLKNLIFKKILKYADSIVVNSKDFKKELDRKFRLNSNLIYNPLNINEIKKKSKIKINLRFFESKKTLKIINIARFTDQKDHLTLLKSFKLICKKINAKLLIVGYGKNKYKIQNFIEMHNLKEHVKIIDFQKNPYPYLRMSDLFIFTSRYEGLPNVLLEALTLKKFIISTDCPTGPREILLNGKCGFLSKMGDYKDIYKKTIFFSKNKKKLEKKILKGFNSLNKYNFTKNSKLYLKLIKKYL